MDPDTHHPAVPEDRFCGSLGFLGNRLPDREARVDEFFLKPAQMLPHCSFVLGGNGWANKDVPENVRAVGHVFTRDHNAFNCSAMAVLNINRDSMVANGYSPATRVFEAAGAGACLISDAFVGIEEFLEPSREVLVAADGTEVAAHLAFLDPMRCRNIGQAARKRVLAHHTYAHRVEELERVLDIGQPPKRTRSFGDARRSERRP
jgi:spore maturation protein CgeB